MARGKRNKGQADNGGANIGFEQKLWEAADILRGNVDPSEYKHVVLGLLFLKYISDAFEERRAQILADPGLGRDFAEQRDAYTMENIFWVPQSARWQMLQDNARQSEIGLLVDQAMVAIEQENPTLKGVLPKEYNSPRLDKRRLGELIDLIATIPLGDTEQRSRDTLGRVYEYFLNKFAGAEGKGGGEFYTPRCIVRLLVHMIEPYRGRVYDPCCGSSGMFVQSVEFVREHANRTQHADANGRRVDISIYGQEANHTTWRLAKMNLAIRGIEANLGIKHADSFHEDLHRDLRADFILANPPFNDSNWGGEQLADDVRWKYGVPPKGNANFAWVQHFIHHLAPGGIAGFVLANGSMSSGQSGEGEIRKNIIEADLVDCMIALPGQLFYGTQIPACLWFLTRTKKNGRFRDRRGETLFIDARRMGQLVDRTHRELTDTEITQIANTYHVWRGQEVTDSDGNTVEYADEAGFCKAATLDDIRGHGHVLTPGRYVGAPEVEDDGEPFPENMARLTKELKAQFAEGRRLEEEIQKNLEGLGYDND